MNTIPKRKKHREEVKPLESEQSSSFISIGKLAKAFGLARSTLLYYDAIGLLRPSGRSVANYRWYTQDDYPKLESICMYRQIGLSMTSIREILQAPQNAVREVLEKQLKELSSEIKRLSDQQQVIIRMLGDASLRERIPFMDKDGWVALMRAAGLDDDSMDKWHREFEAFSPGLHQEFLEGLGIPPEEITKIRQWAVVQRQIRQRHRI